MFPVSSFPVEKNNLVVQNNTTHFTEKNTNCLFERMKNVYKINVKKYFYLWLSIQHPYLLNIIIFSHEF